MTWSCITIFMVIFDLVNIAYPYIGNGIEELIILIFDIILIGISIF